MKSRALTLLLLTFACVGYGQQTITLSNLDAFSAGKNWKIVGDVSSNSGNDGGLATSKGKGILVNIPSDKNHSNLFTKASYSDLDLEVDFMMSDHSNSGIYLMGRYEIQLLDSWGVENPTYGDCGGIYQRRRPDGSQYEGHAPLINACKAPGTWQHMSISFRAPRFNQKGVKISNAKILKVVLNGFTVQENIELTGPTGGPVSEKEVASAPLMIQGDHGHVAFRNMVVTSFEEPSLSFEDISYSLYNGDIKSLQNFQFDGLTTESGKLNSIDIAGFTEEVGWAIVYKANLVIPKSDNYKFSLQAGGESMMKVGGKIAVEKAWTRTNWEPRSGESIYLEAGTVPVEIYYAKVDGWLATGLGIFVESKSIRRSPLHSGLNVGALSGFPAPVYLEANGPRVNRSFMSYPSGEDQIVLTHIVNVGGGEKLHYAYNSANGALVKIWRGEYLDMSPMWSGRGNAQSQARGVELLLPNKNPLAFNDGSNLNYRAKGYTVKKDGFPVFNYLLNGKLVTDEIVPTEGKIVVRTISGEGIQGKAIVAVEAKSINKTSDGRFSINDKDYFIEAAGAEIKAVDGKSQLVLNPTGTALSYKIIW